MKRFVVFLFSFCLALSLSGQVNRYGVPIIRNYNPRISQVAEQNWCITKDIFGNVYFGNQEGGVIKYDGTSWTRIPVGSNPRIYSLASDSRGIVYVGAAFEFGYIQPGSKGIPEYVSLSARLDSISRTEIRYVNSVELEKDVVFFLGAKFLYRYDIVNDILLKINLSKYDLLDALRLARINDKLIVSDTYSGLFELKDSVLIPLPGGDFFQKKICTVLLPYDERKMLIGTYFHGVYLFDYTTGTVNGNFIDPVLNNKLKEVNIYAGSRLVNDLFAIGTTVQEGIMIFNKSGKLVQQLNTENSGLENNTILAMYYNYSNNSELWISTDGSISKAYVNIPITQFSEKQGIEAGINDVCEFMGDIYLSSDAGVMKSRVNDQNFIEFSQIEGINIQVFPLEEINVPSGNILLAGSISGLYQISKNGKVLQVEKNCDNLPPNTNYNIRTIVQSSNDPSLVYIGLEGGGTVILRYKANRWSYIYKTRNTIGNIASVVEKKEGGFWFITDDPSALYSLSINGNDTSIVNYGPDKGIANDKLNFIYNIADEIYLTSSNGIFKYDKSADRFIEDNSLTGEYSRGKNATMLFQDNDGDIWYYGVDRYNENILFRQTPDGIESYVGILRLLPNGSLLGIMQWQEHVYFVISKTLCAVDKPSLKPDSAKVNTFFVKITAGTDSVVMEGTFYKTTDFNRRIPLLKSNSTVIPEFGYDMNDISFEWTTPSYTEELLTEYSYQLEGYEKEWSRWEGISYGNTMEAQYSKKEYTNLPYGHYKFKVRTRTLTGLTGNELDYEFIILKPWYATIIAFFCFILAAFLIIYAIIKAYTRKLKNENIRLEGIVAERTAVVVKQKEELESSIHYASRIQMALLPSENILSENIKNYFVLFKPRDIVSGDFYWMTKKGNRLYIVAADCTGHGVPGAFMSLLGMSFLDEIIDQNVAPRADIVLKELRLHVTESLKQVGGDDEAKDGMDIALLVIDFNVQQIEFSGAYNPCFRIRKLSPAEVKTYKENTGDLPEGTMSNGKYLLDTIYASKMPIGISSRMDEDFVFHNWALEKGVSYYLFSDGYIDQFGGPNGRKFMKKNFKRFLLDIQDYPMDKQKELLEKNLMDWMGHSPQIDDILVMGIRTD